MKETIIVALKLHIKNKIEMSVKNQKTILKYINKQGKEIERLNNIINELEKELDRGYLDLFEYELVNGRELITNIKIIFKN